MNNSTLFKKAHKMTKMTIQQNETYRYKFGQWLIFLKTGAANMAKPQHKRINQSVAYVPILDHDREFVKYRLSLPMTFSKEVKRTNGNTKYIQHWYINKYILDAVEYIFTNPLSLFIMFMITMFIVL